MPSQSAIKQIDINYSYCFKNKLDFPPQVVFQESELQ